MELHRAPIAVPTTLLVALLLVAIAAPVVAAATPTAPAGASRTTAGAATLAGSVRVAIPAKVRKGRLTNVRLTLPASVAAIDGRLLVAKGAATLMGVAVYGPGTALRPVAIKGGYACGAYGLKPLGYLIVDLVLLPRRSGAFSIRVLVDSASSRTGRRVAVSGARVTGIHRRGSLQPADRSARGRRRSRPLRVAGPVADALPDSRINSRDIDLARADWEEARALGRTCGARTPGDLNGDGCTDAVDLQATVAQQGTRLVWRKSVHITADDETTRRQVVTSTADTPDAAPGNGTCADSQGRCTLRAAIQEAEYLAGDDRITFDLPGSAPVTIQVGFAPAHDHLARRGPWSSTATPRQAPARTTRRAAPTPVPGVVIRGNGAGAKEVGLYITSAGNLVRGVAITNFYRGVFIDGTGASGNRIVGNWIGFDGSGASQANGQYGVVLNTGSHDNQVGGPAAADINVIGAWRTAVNLYGPGTDRNAVQGNLLCMRPGGQTAICSSGVDHNFGPKESLIGGDAAGEANIIGPTILQGIELSHGWDPKLPYGTDTATTWQVNGNRVIGNWIGFRADGTYAAAYRSGQELSNSDNGNGINCYDGTNDNLIARNFIAATYDGIQVMSPNASGNIVRGNTIGKSPRGEAAPLTGWGIVVRWGTRHDEVVNNTIRGADKGGVGLLNVNNRGEEMSVAQHPHLAHDRDRHQRARSPARARPGIAPARPRTARRAAGHHGGDGRRRPRHGRSRARPWRSTAPAAVPLRAACPWSTWVIRAWTPTARGRLAASPSPTARA